MPKIVNSISAPYRQKDLFDLVADIDSYPEFLPWCEAVRIKDAKDNIIIAELLIKYKIFRGSYVSRVTLNPCQEIKAELIKGPFKFLRNSWGFIAQENGTKIEFMLEFELTSKILSNLISNELEHYYKKMFNAFLARAKEKIIY